MKNFVKRSCMFVIAVLFIRNTEQANQTTSNTVSTGILAPSSNVVLNTSSASIANGLAAPTPTLVASTSIVSTSVNTDANSVTSSEKIDASPTPLPKVGAPNVNASASSSPKKLVKTSAGVAKPSSATKVINASPSSKSSVNTQTSSVANVKPSPTGGASASSLVTKPNKATSSVSSSVEVSPAAIVRETNSTSIKSPNAKPSNTGNGTAAINSSTSFLLVTVTLVFFFNTI